MHKQVCIFLTGLRKKWQLKKKYDIIFHFYPSSLQCNNENIFKFITTMQFNWD